MSCGCGATRKLWHHHKHGARCWSCLRRMFTGCGNLTPTHAKMLGWHQDRELANSPLQVVLG